MGKAKQANEAKWGGGGKSENRLMDDSEIERALTEDPAGPGAC